MGDRRHGTRALRVADVAIRRQWPDRWIVDAGFALLVLITVAYFLRRMPASDVRTDDFALDAVDVVRRLLRAVYNDHLATVHIAIYKTIYELFGLGTNLPLRMVGIGTTVASRLGCIS